MNPREIPTRRKVAGTKFKAAENAATAACAETLGSSKQVLIPFFESARYDSPL
jgi:hypothetical protein